MSGSLYLNQLAKLEHENDLLRDSYEEVSAHLEAMAKMRDELKKQVEAIDKDNRNHCDEIAGLMSQRDVFKAQFDKAMEENLVLMASLRGAIKDKERIEWLADKNQTIGNVQLPAECVENNLTSLRDAIDCAMAMDAKQNEEEE